MAVTDYLLFGVEMFPSSPASPELHSETKADTNQMRQILQQAISEENTGVLRKTVDLTDVSDG